LDAEIREPAQSRASAFDSVPPAPDPPTHLSPPSPKPTPPLALHVCAVDFTAWHFLRPIVRWQRERGWRVAICCGRGPYFERMEAEGIELHAIPVRRGLNPLAHLRSLFGLWRLMRQSRPDAVHVHTPIAGWLGRLAARLARVTKVYYTVHGFLFHEGASPAFAWAARLAERVAAPWTDAMFFVSAEDREEAARLRLLPEDRLVHCGNGVDVSALAPARWREAGAAFREKHGLPADAFVVGFVGRMVREKGVLDLVDAFARLCRDWPGDARLILVGEALPSDRRRALEEARAMAARLGVAERVLFAGMLDPPWEAVAAMDAFVLPSWREGMPTSLLEAMALGRACVATRVRGCREAIDAPGENGLLIPPRDPARLAEALRRLAERPELRARLGATARRDAERRFGQERVFEALAPFYAGADCREGDSVGAKRTV
jgi:glycosyltransferase involved in cell wall biosynthesis